MDGQRSGLFDAAVEIEGGIFLATSARGAGRADILACVEDVGEIGIVDLLDDAADILTGAGDAAVVVVVQTDDHPLFLTVFGHFLKAGDHAGPYGFFCVTLGDPGGKDADQGDAYKGGDVYPVFGGVDLFLELFLRLAEVGADADVGEGYTALERLHADAAQIVGFGGGKGAGVDVDAVEVELVGALDESFEAEIAGGEFIFIAEGHAAEFHHDARSPIV